MTSPRFLLGLVLTGVAGAIDAISFLRLGAVYASFMSGNSVQLGLHVAASDWLFVSYFLVLIGVFVVGGFLGAAIRTKAEPSHVVLVLAFEAAAVGTSLWLDLRHAGPLASTALLSLAMGAQNNLVVLVRGANPGTTFVTGTLFRFAEAASQRVLGRDPAGAWKLLGLVWLAFLVGAALGTFAQTRLQDLAIAAVAAVLAALTLAALAARLMPRSARGEGA